MSSTAAVIGVLLLLLLLLVLPVLLERCCRRSTDYKAIEVTMMKWCGFILHALKGSLSPVMNWYIGRYAPGHFSKRALVARPTVTLRFACSLSYLGAHSLIGSVELYV